MFNSFQFGSGATSLTKFAVNNVEAAVGIDFVNQQYRLADQPVTFADAFIGSSPDLTYSTTGNSTMVDSSGDLVWAPHNLITYSEAFENSAWLKTDATISGTLTSSPDGQTNGRTVTFAGTNDLLRFIGPSCSVGESYSVSIWAKAGTSNSVKFSILFSGSGLGQVNENITLTSEWQRFTISATVPSGTPDTARLRLTSLEAGSVQVFGAQFNRSDLGGMAPVPGAATGLETYVPTNGTVEYLPRVGHHVYNGSTWVNEGLLLESEARTNLRTYSTVPDSTNAYRVNATSTSSTETAPDGSTDAVLLTATGTAADNAWDNYNNTYGSYDETVQTYSFWIKAEDATSVTLGLFGKSVTYTFATDSITTPTDATGHVEHYGNGWVRLGCTATQTNEFHYWQVKLDGTTKTAHVWGVQLEIASTPSSYIPTSGATVTRATQTLDIPPAQFSWPDVEYIGSELVVDNNGNYVGDFNSLTDINSWSNDGTSVISILPEDQLFIDRNGSTTQSGHRVATIALSGLTIGKAYRVGVNVVELSNNFNIVVFDNSYSILRENTDSSSTGIQTLTFEATVTDPIIGLSLNTLNATAKVTDVSVREVNPLSVSIQMDGRITYADDDVTSQARFYLWASSSSDRIQNRLYTNTGTGGVNVYQSATNGGSASSAFDNVYPPGINVPFNVASRHGSTFVNGAVDGVALTAKTTPTALPDLSGTNLQIAYDFMGTIGTFRQFAGDVGDAGLVTATNPSTEPTLSLTFDGTASGSFYNLNWSK